MKTTMCFLAALLLAALLLAGCNDGGLVKPGPTPTPTAAAGATPVAVILAGGSSQSHPVLDGSSSYDPDDSTPGAIMAYQWTLVLKPAGSAAVLLSTGGAGEGVQISADENGSYSIDLVVIDRDGLHSDAASYTFLWLPVQIDGDCVTAQCPATDPYPTGCDIVMDGGDSRGCVASTPTSSVVYFQEGDVCSAGHVSGWLLCSSQPGPALGTSNCPINKADKFYPTSPSLCP